MSYRTAIVQARMGSTRLPGKVLMDIAGKTMLEHVVSRAGAASNLDRVVVATTHDPIDNDIVDECDRLNIACFRGDPLDVLDRYHRCAAYVNAKTIVRITSDCPLIDPSVIDTVIAARSDGDLDYASNTVERTYPRGLDTEAFTAEALETAWSQATQPHEREHVTPYIYQHPDRFRCEQVKAPAGHSRDGRWTVDTEDDLAFARAILAETGDALDWTEIAAFLDTRPDIQKINAHVEQKKLTAP